MKQIKKIPLTISITAAVIFLLLSGCGMVRKGNNRPSISFNRGVKEESLEPDAHFTTALKDFVNQNYEGSYLEIQEGIKYMEGIAAISNVQNRKNINESINELMELSDNVRFDKIDGVCELNYYFSRAGRAIGNHHIIISEKIVKNRKQDNPDYSLDIEINNLDKPGKGIRRGYRSEENQILSETGKIARQISSEYDIQKNETQKLMSELKSGLTTLG